MSTPNYDPPTTDVQQVNTTKEPRAQRQSSRQQLAHSASRAVGQRTNSSQDTASANFVIVAERVEVTNNFNF
ncbi:putative movement protein 1 [Bermuda grass latent virus]|uniref:putative movement protein 1 n=1 Tax=Bermuda grass latent virus TaxID=1930269 RepID=UPI0009486A22|nr:putative movement protein 1 [Bermuda grass latent virus]APQ46238.1 putative movement protein 1 [Bermuda grass latent virus]